MKDQLSVLNCWTKEYAIGLKQNADQLISNVLTSQNINNINSQNLGMAIELYLKSIHLLKNEPNNEETLLSKYLSKIENNNIDNKENFLKFIDSELRKIGTVSKTSHNISHLIKNVLMYDETLFFYQLATIKYRRYFENNKIEYVNNKEFYSGIDHMILTGDGLVIQLLLTKMGELKDWVENNHKTPIDKLIVDARYNKINVNSDDFEKIKEIAFVLNIINEYNISKLQLENNQLNDINLRKSINQLDEIGLKYINGIMKNKVFNYTQLLNSISFINFIKYYIEKNQIKYDLSELKKIYNIILNIVANKFDPNKTISFEDYIEYKKSVLLDNEKNKINEIDPGFLNSTLDENIEALASFLNETLMSNISYHLNYNYKGKNIPLYDVANKIERGKIILSLKQKLFMINAGEGSKNYLLYASSNIINNYDRVLCRLCDKCDIKISEYMYKYNNPKRVIEILERYKNLKKIKTINLNIDDLLLCSHSISIDKMFEIIEYCNKYNVDFFTNMVENNLNLEEILLIIKTCVENNVVPIEEMFGYDKNFEFEIDKTTDEIIEIIKFCGKNKIKKIYNGLLGSHFTTEEILKLLDFCSTNNIPFVEDMFVFRMSTEEIIQILNHCIKNNVNVEKTFSNIISERIEKINKVCINEKDKYEYENDETAENFDLKKKIYSFCEANNIQLGHVFIDKIPENVDVIDILETCVKYHIYPITEMFYCNLTTEEIKQIIIKCSDKNIPLFESLLNSEVDNTEEIGDSLNPLNKKFIIKK